jgi:hypothetical protein
MPVVQTPFYWLLTKLQFVALRWGYATAKLTPPPSSRGNGISWPKEALEEQEMSFTEKAGREQLQPKQ